MSPRRIGMYRDVTACSLVVASDSERIENSWGYSTIDYTRFSILQFKTGTLIRMRSIAVDNPKSREYNAITRFIYRY